MKRIGLIVLSAVFAFGLASCSSGSSDKGAKNADGATTTTAAKGSDSNPDEPVAPPSTGAIDREPSAEGTGIIDTTEMSSCDTKPGEVTASGTVQLPEGMEPSTVSISVAWVNADTATVFSRSRVEVEDVTADESKDWKVDNILPDNGVAVRCVLGAVALDQ